MLRKLVVLLVATLWCPSCAEKLETIAVPTSGPSTTAASVSWLDVPSSWVLGERVLPVSYLEHLPVEDRTLLSRDERKKLARLIRAAHEESVQRYKQSYYLSTKAPIWRVIERNCPGADRLIGEGGTMVYLGVLADFLESRCGA